MPALTVSPDPWRACLSRDHRAKTEAIFEEGLAQFSHRVKKTACCWEALVPKVAEQSRHHVGLGQDGIPVLDWHNPTLDASCEGHHMACPCLANLVKQSHGGPGDLLGHNIGDEEASQDLDAACCSGEEGRQLVLLSLSEKMPEASIRAPQPLHDVEALLAQFLRLQRCSFVALLCCGPKGQRRCQWDHNSVQGVDEAQR